jgi:histidinol phosphatase-like PHP family hydrolase
LINLHNHSNWSDGLYPPELLAKMAAVGGLTHIGISDHFYTQKLAGSGAYVDVDELEDYVAELRDVGERLSEHVQVLAGIEVDWSPRSRNKLPALWAQAGLLDYVLFEYVQDEAMQGDSLNTLLMVRHAIPVPAGLAHNDLSRNFGGRFAPRKLVALLQEHDLFVELSTDPRTINYGGRDAYSRELWAALAESRVRFSIGSDTHAEIDEVSRVAHAYAFLQEQGLVQRLITADWDPVRRTWRDRAAR